MINWFKKFFLYSLISIFVIQISAFAAVINPIKVKAAAPENPTLILKGDAQYTNSNNISISIVNDTDAVAWLVTEDSDIPDPADVNMTPEPTAFNLSVGDGLKTVYIWVKNVSDEINIGISESSIILDTTVPDVTGLNITGPSSPTDNPAFNFTWTTATDGTSGSGLDKYDFWFGRGATKDFEKELDASVSNYTLSLSEQALLQHGKTYHAKIRAYDKAGNVSNYSTYSNNILFQDDKFYPGEKSISINNGAEFTNSRDVNVIVSATDYWVPVEMRVSEDNTFISAAWIDFTTNYNYLLSTGDGLKNIYVQFRDAGGNKSDVLSASITLDTTLPVPGPAGLLTAPEDIYGKVIDITYEVSDVTSGMDYLMLFYQRNGGEEQSVKINGPFSAHVYPLDVSSLGEGVYTFYGKAYDKAGNILEENLSHAINVVFPAPVSPGNLQLTFHNDEATVSWDTVADADWYQVRYTKNSYTSDWFQTTGTSMKILVEPDSDYTFEVQAFGNGKFGLISSISGHSPVVKVTRAVEVSSSIDTFIPEVEAAPSQVEEVIPEETVPEGEIKGGENETGGTDWTKIIITIAILIIAAGIGTAGWYAYQWWVAGDISEAPETKEEEKEDKSKKRKTRW